MNELEDVHNALYVWRRGKGGWRREQVPMPALASFSAWAWDADESDDYWVSQSSYVAPASLALATRRKSEVLKRAPVFFDATGLDVASTS